MPTAPDNPYLSETLLTVTEQTVGDWEVVLVLDGESASNRATAERVMPPDRVTIVETPAPRSGPAVARNVGIRVSNHPLIAFLDADDLCSTDRLARQARILDENSNAGMVGAWATKFAADNRTAGSLRPPTDTARVGRTMLLYNCLVTSTITARRSVLTEVGGFNPQCVRLEDYDLWLRVLAKYDIAVVGDELLRYRVHDTQYSRGRILGSQTRLLAASRHAAARRLGVSWLGSTARHAAWWGVQVANRRW